MLNNYGKNKERKQKKSDSTDILYPVASSAAIRSVNRIYNTRAKAANNFKFDAKQVAYEYELVSYFVKRLRSKSYVIAEIGNENTKRWN